jgi:hypothetical protein
MEERVSKQVDKQLVDEAMDAYVDWREECAGVWDAYERWARAPKIDAARAFSAYRAALDREECASHAYVGLLARIGRVKGPVGGLFERTILAFNS